MNRRTALVLLILSALLGPAAPSPLAEASGAANARATAPTAAEVVVTSVSNPRPQHVSGGDVLVRVRGAAPGAVRIERNGSDVTARFRRQGDGSYLGLVGGLRVGANVIEAVPATAGAPPLGPSARLDVDNHPITGPVFSGPQQVPFFCETEKFGLDPARQPRCSAPTEVSYVYSTTGGAFLPLADPDSPPGDAATVTIGGRTLPYVVRLERGTIDRAVYQVAGVYDGGAPDPLGPDRGWNRRLVFSFGGGCNGGYHQGAVTGNVLNDEFLSRGYVVASSTLNVLNVNCSPIISAEAAMMVKEHVLETYGPARHTIGWGGSGGAIQQYDIAASYPGILDGIVPGISFPDPFTTLGPVVDCGLLNRFFAASDVGFNQSEQTAVEGFGNPLACERWEERFFNRATATGSCDPAIPLSARWDAETNPDGVKCSAAEQFVNQLGRDSHTGFVRGVLDNVGVQYGLEALHDGAITAAQFVELNAEIGGLDVAGEIVDARSRADIAAVGRAYRANLVVNGGLGLARTPVIDLRNYLDAAPTGNIHTAEWSYVMRQRMIEQRTIANQVIIEHDSASAADASAYALDAMDRWLTRIGTDHEPGTPAEKVARNRPGDLGDGCYLADGTRIRERLRYRGDGRCAQRYPIYSNPRLAAGEPLTREVLKCRLAPIDFDDYPVRFTARQRATLDEAFPRGVCDFTRPGVNQRPPAGTWIDCSG